MIFGGGLLGFEIGAGLAARLHGGVTMEVTEVKVQDGKLVAVRPILQDSAVVDVGYSDDGPAVIIGRLNAFEIAESGGGDAEVEELSVDLSDWSTKATMVQRGEQRGADVNIEDADILVGGGRGLGKAEGFQELAEPLADALGGAVAATRAVVDAGWFPYAGQIGQTGKTVAPKLYLAVGISGAIQHKVGMQSSENIVAINKDPNAPIFEFSDLGIVGDLHKIVPKLTEAIKAKKGAEPPMATAPAEFLPDVESGEGVRHRADRSGGRADRSRRRDRGRRPGRAGVRDPADAADLGGREADGAPRRGARRARREGQGPRART